MENGIKKWAKPISYRHHAGKVLPSPKHRRKPKENLVAPSCGEGVTARKDGQMGNVSAVAVPLAKEDYLVRQKAIASAI